MQKLKMKPQKIVASAKVEIDAKKKVALAEVKAEVANYR